MRSATEVLTRRRASPFLHFLKFYDNSWHFTRTVFTNKIKQKVLLIYPASLMHGNIQTDAINLMSSITPLITTMWLHLIIVLLQASKPCKILCNQIICLEGQNELRLKALGNKEHMEHRVPSGTSSLNQKPDSFK